MLGPIKAGGCAYMRFIWPFTAFLHNFARFCVFLRIFPLCRAFLWFGISFFKVFLSFIMFGMSFFKVFFKFLSFGPIYA